MTIAYNHLNLPKQMTFATEAGSNSIEVLYDAAGTKLRKTVKTGTTVNYTQDYIAGIEYRDGAREAIYTAEGRVFYTSPTTIRYEYSIKDHLGNTRLTFTDKNANGVVDVTPSISTNEILQENHYYPFGLNTEGPWMNDASLDNKYQYNGKELNEDFGLNWNDYGARWYDASVGRFIAIDPVSGMYSTFSPYSYTMNNPLKYIDPTGMMSEAYSFGSTNYEMSLWDMAENERQKAENSRMQELIDLAEQNGGHYSFNQTKDVTFDKLESGYPSKKEIAHKDKAGKEIYMHSCAIRVSHALREAGVKFKGYEGAMCRNCSFGTTGKKYHALIAQELADWLENANIKGISNPVYLKGNTWEDYVDGKTGIVFFQNYWQKESDTSVKRTGDHIDLWNKNELVSNGVLMTWMRTTFPAFSEDYLDSSDLGKSSQIIFWEVK